MMKLDHTCMGLILLLNGHVLRSTFFGVNISRLVYFARVSSQI